MKKRYWLIGVFALMQWQSKAQTAQDSVQKVKQTDIELVYHHYIQDGNNSAITGGLGTEELKVYGPALTVKTTSQNQAISIHMGSDIISSASTDKIDFIPSSASSKDARTYFSASYERSLAQDRWEVYGSLGFSVESDYSSIYSDVGFIQKEPKGMRTLTAQFQMFHDDLRWGRLNSDYRKPSFLIYPAELRGREEWYDEYRRHSYNLKLGWQQIMNQRNIIGVYPEFTYQKGLLATPFHRVYFNDESLAVENLPSDRYKGALALKWNTFLGGRVILKNTIDAYTDSFGITAWGIQNETAIKLHRIMTLLPNIRFYQQAQSRYFAPYKEHLTEEEFYTSDFDLSKFYTLDVGLGIKLIPLQKRLDKTHIQAIILRYNYLHRSNGLKGHSFSVALQASKMKMKKL